MKSKKGQIKDSAQEFAEACDAAGITIAATFVPFSQSRNKSERQPSLNWRLDILVKGRVALSGVDYMQGCGHAPAYKNPIMFPGRPTKVDQWRTDQAIKMECESGRISSTFAADNVFSSARIIPPPSVADVMYSLLCESESLDYSSFSEWCENLGYSDDSIKARAAYDACLATGLALRAALGAETLSNLHNLSREY